MAKLQDLARLEKWLKPERAAIVYMLFSQFFTSLVGALSKSIEGSIFYMLYHRSLFIILLIFMHSSDQLIPKLDLKWLLFLSLIMGLSSQFYFASIKMIPILETNLLDELNTIWCQIIAFIIFGEVLSLRRIKNITLSIVGLVLITKPQIFFGAPSAFDKNHLIGVGCGFFAGLTLAFAYSILRVMKSETSSTARVFYTQMGNMLVGNMMIVWLEEKIDFTMSYVVHLVIISILTYFAEQLFQHSLLLSSYSVLAPYTYSLVLFSLLLDYLIFEIVPTFISGLGGVLILISIFMSIKNV